MIDRHHQARGRFGIRFSLLARRWRRGVEEHLAAAGLTAATWAPLIHLDETGGGISQKELAALVGVDGSSLVRVLDILARQGLIARRADEADKRARLIDLTEAGKRRVEEIRIELSRAEEAMLVDIADSEIASMLAHFERISKRLDAMSAQSQAGDV